MIAVQLTDFGIHNFQVNEIEKPSPQSGQVLVNIKAVSLNYLDVILANGSFYKDLCFPYIPASDGAGVVESVGEDVTRWKIGDRVAVQYVQNWTKGNIDRASNLVRVGWQTPGVMAEYVCLPEHGLVKAPDNLSFEETATLPIAALTAWHAFRKFFKDYVEQGETVMLSYNDVSL
jgi:NADPH:quinone reductase-like Zn-dependent oxidoreductase